MHSAAKCYCFYLEKGHVLNLTVSSCDLILLCCFKHILTIVMSQTLEKIPVLRRGNEDIHNSHYLVWHTDILATCSGEERLENPLAALLTSTLYSHTLLFKQPMNDNIWWFWR